MKFCVVKIMDMSASFILIIILFYTDLKYGDSEKILRLSWDKLEPSYFSILFKFLYTYLSVCVTPIKTIEVENSLLAIAANYHFHLR
jgi:hypothetical protein